ncbi:hypothetical protein PsYK624_032390 [Phanerochaete sordida]|uniref:Uncharacterized protein n=1 Tax=Phanerochaete sordida TaxID=48140 RepID=A0A9P3G2N6_9APHY|nr:hypothetical protein PsYK624_032390 [Phanerochaete sordida]
MPRSDSIELDDLRKRPTLDPEAERPKHGRINLDANQEQTIASWAYASSALLFACAIPMILFPSFLLYLAEPTDERRVALTPLESFLCTNSGILLTAFAAALLFSIPTPSDTLQLPSTAQGHPLLVPLTAACSIISLTSYNRKSVGALAFLVFLGSSIIAVWGAWTLLFSGTSYISRKTGADKRTSGFIFGNKAAASSQKKEWKKQQDAR